MNHVLTRQLGSHVVNNSLNQIQFSQEVSNILSPNITIQSS